MVGGPEHSAALGPSTVAALTTMAFLFSSPIDVDVKLEGEESRKQVEIKGEKERMVSCPVYYDGDSVGGQVCVCFGLVRCIWVRSKGVFWLVDRDTGEGWEEIGA